MDIIMTEKVKFSKGEMEIIDEVISIFDEIYHKCTPPIDDEASAIIANIREFLGYHAFDC